MTDPTTIAAEAMREAAARVAEAEADNIRAQGQDRDSWQQGRMMMADAIAAAIRALPIAEQQEKRA